MHCRTALTTCNLDLNLGLYASIHVYRTHHAVPPAGVVQISQHAQKPVRV